MVSSDLCAGESSFRALHESGFLVTPGTCTRRVPSWIANNTYSVRSMSVSTVKKSNARIPWAWARRTRPTWGRHGEEPGRGLLPAGACGSSWPTLGLRVSPARPGS
jgi:hypothetical protein